MKQKFILMVCLLFSGLCAHAQVSARSGNPDLKLEFKRCIVQGDMAYIDLLVNNVSNRDCNIGFNSDHAGLSVYDDEGNVYNNMNISLFANFKVYPMVGGVRLNPGQSAVFPAGIATKVRIMITDGFDPYAVSLQLVSISFSWDVFGTKSYGNYETGKFELRNLPIIRE